MKDSPTVTSSPRPLLSTLFEDPGTVDESTYLLREEEVPLQPTALTTKPSSNNTNTIFTTLLGALTFSLYHIVFCLAAAATLDNNNNTTKDDVEHNNNKNMGPLAQMAAMGIVVAGPIFVRMIPNVPAVYPTCDLFVAPFLAHAAETIQRHLQEQEEVVSTQQQHLVFLTTFSTLMVCGFVLSGILCIAAARFKLANLGSFLPYEVLCGFFTTIGLLIWSLGFSVDTGIKIQHLFQQTQSTAWTAIVHHAPSLLVGTAMHLCGPKHPFAVILLLLFTVLAFYFVMFLTGTSLQQAQELKWFYTVEDLVPMTTTTDGSRTTTKFAWEPPMPFGYIPSAWNGNLHQGAFMEGIPIITALVLLYVIRSSLHSAALRKNIPNVSRKEEWKTKQVAMPTLTEILERGYGYSQIAASLVGGLPVAPSVAAANTMFQLGAASAPPQYLSCLLVIVFYVTNFRIVQYIPKAAFSCLMVLAGLDMIKTWLIGSYRKTKHKTEWAVAPILAALAFTVGVLYAIFIGVALSTFIFVGHFYRAGTVKFVGSSLFLHSTVERGVRETEWLKQNGDYIQILVLQNYLFFGNIQSVSMYVSTMFETKPENGGTFQSYVPPLPKYLVIDFALVTGVDGSTTDSFREILDLCRFNGTSLFLCGMKPSLKSMFAYASLKPKRGVKDFLFFGDLEQALAKAEDRLVSEIYRLEENDRMESTRRRRSRKDSIVEDGFLYSLKKIDEYHGLDCSVKLELLGQYATVVELEPNEILRRSDESGLYFVEVGLMRVTSAREGVMNSQTVNTGNELVYDPVESIGHLNARGSVIARQQADLKRSMIAQSHQQSFRLARIGQGWVIGSIEVTNGMQRPGAHVAVTQCRLHHVSKSSLKQIESKHPDVAMNLYKLLACLSTKRQEATIQQLGQFVHILNSPVPHLRGGKSGLGQLHLS